MEELPITIKKGGLSLILNILTVLFLIGVTLIATRKLDPEDYGLYQFVLSLTQYSWILLGIVTFFSSRQIARGNNVLKESITIGFTVILLETLVFLFLFYLLKNIFELNVYLIIISSIYAFILMTSYLFNSIVFSINVVASYFLNFIQAVSRFFIILLLLYFLNFPINVETFIIALLLSILLTFPYYIKEIKKIRTSNSNIKLISLIKSLWYYPLITSIVSVAASNDTVFMGIFLASTLPIAFFRVAYFVSNPINYVQAITSVYYREFLERKDLKLFEQSIKTNLLYTTMICFLIFGEGNIVISIFRPVYLQSYTTAIILAFSFILLSLSNLFSQAILGFEKEDVENTKKLFKKSLFYFNFKVDLFSLIFQYALLTILVYFSKSYSLESHTIAFYWSIIWLSVSIFSFLNRLNLFRKHYKFNFPLKYVIRYIIASFVAGLLVYYLRPNIVVGQLYYQIGIAVLFALLYFAIYVPLLLFLDKSIRRRFLILVKSILKIRIS
jgi:Polysaccharide biosynthesis protein.